jgi:integrase
MVRFIKEYLPGIKPASGYRYLVSIRRLAKHFEGVALEDITKGTLADFVSARKKEVVDATIRRDLACMGTMLSCAVDWDWLEANPMKLYSKRSLKEATPRTRFLTDAEYKTLLEHAGTLKPIVILAVETGLRLGEILRLEWRDVDFDRGELHVREGKTGERTVPLSEIGSAQISAQPRHVVSRLVFWHGEGLAYRVDAVSARFSKLTRAAKIKDLRFHDLRHTFATRAIKGRQLDLYRIQRILGHKGPQMTQRYAHLQADDLKPAGTKPGT